VLALALGTGGAIWWHVERAETLTEPLFKIVEGEKFSLNDEQADRNDAIFRG
jgi:hypothetical protein